MASVREVKGVSSKPPEEQRVAKPGFLDGMKHYIAELQFEWRKVSFPSRKELQQSTIVVFVFTLLVMGIIVLLDIAVSFVFTRVILPPAS